jgi:hypothetical protein
MWILNKICLFLAKGICIYVGHSFFMKYSWTNSLNLSVRVRNSRVEGREVKCFNLIVGGEESRLYVLPLLGRDRSYFVKH